jgi:hypothetical protein
MTTTAAVAWCLLCCGVTALFTALWWYAAHEQTKRAHARTYEDLLTERSRAGALRAALDLAHDDLRRHGINGAKRSSDTHRRILRSVK